MNKKINIKNQKKLNVPSFKSESEERNFWKKINLNDYFQAKDFQAVSFPNLKPSSRSISIRLPEYLLARVKEKANELDIPYQSLIKEYIAKNVLIKNEIKFPILSKS
jgi:predicted DNA binding CopG/RHH family protein